MDQNTSDIKKKVFLFHVDVVIEGHNKMAAQEALNTLLRNDNIKYFQFESETAQSDEDETDHQKTKKKEHLKVIDSKPQETKQHEAKLHETKAKLHEAKAKLHEAKLNEAKLHDMKQQEAKHKANAGYRDIINQIETFKKNNTLIRLSIVKSKGVKLSIPCRVLNYEDATQNVTVYHVDEKKVYQYSLNEIDDLVTG
jgi:hypothetical protein